MKIPNISGLTNVAKLGKAFVLANRPELLFGASVVSTVSAVVLSGRGGYQAGQKVLRAEYSDLDLVSAEGKTKTLSVKEKIELTWLCYMPAAMTTLGALGSTTGLHIVHINEKKALAMAGLAAVDEVKNQALEYQKKAIAIVGDDELSDDEKRDKLEGVDWRSEAAWTADILPSDGKYQCWDDLANRAVKSNRDYILKASEVLLAEINKTGKANLNLFYDELGMLESQMGAQLGWAREDIQGYGGSKGLDFVQFGLTELPDGSSATAFWFREPPTTDYENRASSAPS